MECTAALPSLNWCAGTTMDTRSSLEWPAMASWSTLHKPIIKGVAVGKFFSGRRVRILAPCSKATKVIVSLKDDSIPDSSSEKHELQNATFPDGFEALILGVCDDTSVAELKIKVGDFQLHLKRNVDAVIAQLTVSSPVIEPAGSPEISQSATSPPSSIPKTSPGKADPFVNPSLVASSKLAALEATGSSGYKLVSSPTVGSFRIGRTVQDKKQPPICKEGDIIKEGQVIGYVDQFGTELPVKADVSGRILKVLFAEGEAVGYGDPLVAVLP